MSDVEMENDDVRGPSDQSKEYVYVPGKTKTAKAEEELEYDPKAYMVYRQFEAGVLSVVLFGGSKRFHHFLCRVSMPEFRSTT